MTDATTEFFQDLGARGHEPLLKKATGTVRFDLSNGKRRAHWLVTIKKGDVTVSQRNDRADCVARADSGVPAQGRAFSVGPVLQPRRLDRR